MKNLIAVFHVVAGVFMMLVFIPRLLNVSLSYALVISILGILLISSVVLFLFRKNRKSRSGTIKRKDNN